MNKLQTAFMALVLLCVYACKDNKKHPDPRPAPVVYDSYAALKTGNYWVYQLYEVDSLGVGLPLNEFDSCYISKDTTMQGHTYYFLTSDATMTAISDHNWYRDSLHYIISQNGFICFSSQDFTTIFHNTTFSNAPGSEVMADISTQMVARDKGFHTPAGDWITHNFRITYTMRPGYRQSGYQRYINRRYAKNVGIVSETLPFFVMQSGPPRYQERRLVRYHIN